MKIEKKTLIGSIIAAGLLLAGLGVYAGYDDPQGADFTPMTIPYQGVLERDGGLVNGTVHFRLSLWNAAAEGTRIWGPEEHEDVTVQDGRFSLIIGETAALSHSHMENKPVFLQIEPQIVGLDADYETLAHRQQLHASPYAIRAYRAMYAETAAVVDSLEDHNIYTNGSNVGIGSAPSASASLRVGGSGGANVELEVNGRIKSEGGSGGIWVADDQFIGATSGGPGLWKNGWRFYVDSAGNSNVSGDLNVSGKVKGKNLDLDCERKEVELPSGDDVQRYLTCSSGYLMTGCGCMSHYRACDGTILTSATRCLIQNGGDRAAWGWAICCRVN